MLVTLRGERVNKVHGNKFPAYCQNRTFGSISVSGQLPTYPFPNPTLTLTCCQLTVVELGKG